MSTSTAAVRPRRRTLRAAIAGLVLGTAAALALGIAPASAHVHVDGDDATQGGYGVLTFRVPTESDTASTVEVEVTFPTSTPIAQVSYQPVAGWTTTITTTKLSTPITTDDGTIDTAVSKVTWKAKSTADGIKPGQFQRFSLSAGPLPRVSEIVLPTKQTYSDGTVVNWNQTQTGDAEPEHPAPTLEIAAATSTGHGASATASTAAAMDMTASDNATSTATGLAIAGLAAGLVGVVIALVAVARTRRPRA